MNLKQVSFLLLATVFCGRTQASYFGKSMAQELPKTQIKSSDIAKVWQNNFGEGIEGYSANLKTGGLVVANKTPGGIVSWIERPGSFMRELGANENFNVLKKLYRKNVVQQQAKEKLSGISDLGKMVAEYEEE